MENNECARGACKFPLKYGFYRIWNQPHMFPAYRDYCISCGRQITEYNQTLPENQHLKFEIHHG
jgi:hypothetical protein